MFKQRRGRECREECRRSGATSERNWRCAMKGRAGEVGTGAAPPMSKELSNPSINTRKRYMRNAGSACQVSWVVVGGGWWVVGGGCSCKPQPARWHVKSGWEEEQQWSPPGADAWCDSHTSWEVEAGGSGGCGRKGGSRGLARRRLALRALEPSSQHIQLLSIPRHLRRLENRSRMTHVKAGSSLAAGLQFTLPNQLLSTPACRPAHPPPSIRRSSGAAGCAPAAPPVQTWRWLCSACRRTQWCLGRGGAECKVCSS